MVDDGFWGCKRLVGQRVSVVIVRVCYDANLNLGNMVKQLVGDFGDFFSNLVNIEIHRSCGVKGYVNLDFTLNICFHFFIVWIYLFWNRLIWFFWYSWEDFMDFFDFFVDFNHWLDLFSYILTDKLGLYWFIRLEDFLFWRFISQSFKDRTKSL